MQDLIAQMNGVPINNLQKREQGILTQSDFNTVNGSLTQTFNIGSILSPKDIVANQYQQQP